MAGSMVSNLLAMDLDVPCPQCGYGMWVQYVEIVTQTAVLCPCCRTRVLLRDPTGSMQVSGDAMQRAQEKLERSLKGLRG